METSLRYDSNRRALCLFAKERFTNNEDVVLTVSGSLDTRDGRIDGRAHVRKRFFAPARTTPLAPDRADIGLTYETRRDDVRYGARVRKLLDVTPSGSGMTTLGIRGGVSYGIKRQAAEIEGTIELTHKVFNFQEDQDLRLRLGYDVATRKPYANLRENNWSFQTDFQRSWSVCYDL
ncbi:unnamed product [Ostreococcus tauri]|uniref:Unnamed product n=1 Tax=Ostreococcus tauri TaxID=70448 RepID=A0A090M788_OSTTA|nr:unnamed product [Ostreococcus tauri]CEF98552.1 unnamed product [Ostreococcus tauri]|eukprot:XP_022839331.1 unnamed product [Ostreococcus tauri]